MEIVNHLETDFISDFQRIKIRIFVREINGNEVNILMQNTEKLGQVYGK